MDDLINLRTFAGVTGSDLEAIPAMGWSETLRRAQGSLPSGGGTIFLPPGRYLVVGDPVVIDTNVTLWFSPGAVIDPRRPTPARAQQAGDPRANAVMEIRGAIKAGPHMIFFPPTGVGYLPGSPQQFGPRGEVVFTGERGEFVLPEWWGAGTYDGGQLLYDADAIEAALRAAWANRWDGGRPLAALRIVLPGMYFLRREVRVAPFNDAKPHPDAVWIEGRAAGPGTTTVSPDAVFPDGATLLRVVGAPGFRMENVAMAGDHRASTCLSLEGLGGVPPPDGPESPRPLSSILRGCSFRGGLANDLRVRTGAVVQGVPTVRIEQCWFLPDCVGPAVSLEAAGPAMMSVDQCLFEGRAKSMVRVQGAFVDVMGCRFHNQRPWSQEGLPLRPTSLDWHIEQKAKNSSVQSASAFDEDFEERRRRTWRNDGQPVGLFPFFWREPAGGVDLVLGYFTTVPGSISATHCESLSPQFLFCGESAEVGDCMLTSVVHRQERPDLPASAIPPCVLWAPDNNASLGLLGCQFVESELTTPGRRRASVIQVGNGFAGRVIDLGTLDRNSGVVVRRSDGRDASEVLTRLTNGSG